jgi:outer membrane protein TolC
MNALIRGAAPTQSLCVVCCLLYASIALADDVPGQSRSLTSEAVLASSNLHFPSILESLAERRGADAAVIEANGAFDLVFAANGFTRSAGFWDGSVATGGARQNLRPFGSSVYVDYKLSDGQFPVYEDINNTNDRGELKVGLLFSLLRDRSFDDRRFGVADARLALREADLDLLLTRIGVQQQALIAYWRWVIYGYRLSVYEDLLQLALDREAGLQEQVRRGARAEIFLTENLLNITHRRRLVTSARRDFQTAANGLSYYYRKPDGTPLMPEVVQLPSSPSIGADIDTPDISQVPISTTLSQRPELELLRTAIERARNRVELAENKLRPRVDINFEVSRDFGDIAEGGASRDSTDTIVGLEFSVPLQQRTARGRLIREQAQIDALIQRQQLQQDQIEIEVSNILLELTVANDLLRLAEQEVAQAQAMRDAEQRRFASGASDFFLLNIREETEADARIDFLSADLARRVALTNYDAATVNLERLGIAEQ